MSHTSYDIPTEKARSPEQQNGQMHAQALSLAHQALLDASAIARDVAQARGYFTAEQKRDLKALGFRSEQAHVPCLVIPIHGVNGQIVSHQIRPDAPRINKEGRAMKYESPAGSRAVLDIHPFVQPKLGDPAIPLIITEGARKVDAGISAGLCVIGLQGVYNWRGKNKYDGLTALPDFEDIAFNGRPVYLCFDSDVMLKLEVHRALERLGRFVSNKGATIAYIYLPPGPQGEKVGLDDFLAAGHTTADLLALASPTLRDLPATEGEPSENQAQALLALAENVMYFKGDDGECYARIVRDGHAETRTLSEHGGTFKSWLIQRYTEAHGSAPNATALAQALLGLHARTVETAGVAEVFSRLGWQGDTVYLDLADDAWRAVEIDATGWRIVDAPGVHFRRPRGMLALPEPVHGGNLAELRPFLNLKDDTDWLYIVAWLVGTLMPDGPYAHLALHGQRGAAKSTVTRLLRKIVDPNKALARSTPRDERDLAITAKNSHVVAFDNLSHLQDWLSDAMCRLSSGAAFSTRALYSDDEEYLFSAKRPIVMNGIEEIAVRGDLLDRLILVTLNRIPTRDRRSERQLMKRFEQAHARILGALLDAVSMALRNLPHVTIAELPRMADFALWVEAAAPALGWQPGTFLRAYATNQQQATRLELEASPVGSALLELVRDDSHAYEATTAGELLQALNVLRGYDEKPQRRPKNWPSDAPRLGGALRRVAPALRAVGIEIEFTETRKTRTIHIRYAPDEIAQDCDSNSDSNIEITAPVFSASQSPGDSNDSNDSNLHISSVRERGSGKPEEKKNEKDENKEGMQNTVATVATVSEALESLENSDSKSAVTVAITVATDSPFTLITETADLEALLPRLMGADQLSIDTETTGLDPHTDGVRLLQIALPDGETFLIDAWRTDVLALRPLFEAEVGPTLIGHNLVFDLGFLHEAGLPLPPGSRLFDTMIASQLLHAGKPTPKGTHTLQGVMQRHLQVKLDKGEQKGNWAAVDLSDAQLNYAATDVAHLQALAKVLGDELQTARLAPVMQLEMQALLAMVWLQLAGAPIDREAWTALATTAETEQAAALRILADLEPWPVNWDSGAQVMEALGRRGIDVPNTQEETLQAYVHDPLVAALLAYKKASKACSTYGQGWLKHVHTETGRIYPGYGQTSTAAGRMSCSRPNLQNIPHDAAYRACFKAPPGRVLVKADYSQIELRIAAELSRDAAMLEAFKKGEDLHIRTARALLDHEPTKEDRQLAKAVNFGLLFGMGAPRLQDYARTNYGVTLTTEQAVEIRQRFFATYRGLARWHKRQGDDRNTVTHTVLGRRRVNVDQYTERLNSPVQGTGADILKTALGLLYEDRAAVPSARPVLAVHDEIVIECSEIDAERAAAWLQRHMVAAGEKWLKQVPIEVDVTIARDWAGQPYAAERTETP